MAIKCRRNMDGEETRKWMQGHKERDLFRTRCWFGFSGTRTPSRLFHGGELWLERRRTLAERTLDAASSSYRRARSSYSAPRSRSQCHILTNTSLSHPNVYCPKMRQLDTVEPLRTQRNRTTENRVVLRPQSPATAGYCRICRTPLSDYSLILASKHRA